MNEASASGGQQPAGAEEMFGPDRTCPSCSEPWLRPTQLAGRYRCVNCLVRFQLMPYCPTCGEHSTMVRMRDSLDLVCAGCGGSMLKPV
jgi:hypothetical protein